MGGFRHLFGPVPSRRLGLSLGVDLVPPKTCVYDCVFCQIGKTPSPTWKRAEFVAVSAVLAEVDRWLAEGGKAEHITLAGAGEPTLHIGFGDVLHGIRARCSIPTVLFSNGALLFLPEVREKARIADIAKVSWSGWNEASWRRINRPPPDLSFQRVAEGIRRFAADYAGELWVEVFLVPGLNDSPPALQAIASQVNELGAARIHLNTASRPPADPTVRPAPLKTLQNAAALFHPTAEIPEEMPLQLEGAAPLDRSHIENTVLRHPATAAQLAALLGQPESNVTAELDRLEKEGRVRRIVRAGQIWYGPPA